MNATLSFPPSLSSTFLTNSRPASASTSPNRRKNNSQHNCKRSRLRSQNCKNQQLNRTSTVSPINAPWSRNSTAKSQWWKATKSSCKTRSTPNAVTLLSISIGITWMSIIGTGVTPHRAIIRLKSLKGNKAVILSYSLVLTRYPGSISIRTHVLSVPLTSRCSMSERGSARRTARNSAKIQLMCLTWPLTFADTTQTVHWVNTSTKPSESVQ